MSKRTNIARRKRRNQRGQAIVEFAILAPLIVMMLLFSQWLWEVVTIKLKVQEAARYAAWEATSYPLHDYGAGPSANSTLATTMIARVTAETALRYTDMDSSTAFPMGMSMLMASWTPPVPVILNQQERLTYGGGSSNAFFSLADLVGNVALPLIDLIRAFTYSSANKYANIMVAAGSGSGGAGAYRLLGNPAWGFNRKGYVHARILTQVKNEWFNVRILGKPIFNREHIMLQHHHLVVADSWRLHEGDSVYGGKKKPGVDKQRKFWKQVDRMYLVNGATRGVTKGVLAAYYIIGQALGAWIVGSGNRMELKDFDTAALTSIAYGDNPGKASIKEDKGSNDYDTAPFNDAYKKTYEGRGNHFMGCTQPQQLVCGNSTLSQDNPFGDFIVRE